MTARGKWTLWLVPALIIAVFALWAMLGAKGEETETAAALRVQAGLVGRALGPSLAAAAAARHELDELSADRLLDEARLLARLAAADGLDDAETRRLVQETALTAVAVIDRSGQVRYKAGERLPSLLLRQAEQVALGRPDALVSDRVAEMGPGHLAAAVRVPTGGAVVVLLDAASSYAFGRQLGVSNLLREIVGAEGVLYLVYSEPGKPDVAASWDGRPAPLAPGGPRRVFGGRAVYEVNVPVDGPAGHAARLRVGLDASPLARAAKVAHQRELIAAIVLAFLGLLATAYAGAVRLRASERTEHARRLAMVEEARRRSERLAAAGALAAGLAHEVRSPLNAMGLAAQRLERRVGPDAIARGLAARIRTEIRRLDTVLEGFLGLAKPGSGARTRSDLASLARDVAGLLEPEAREKAVTLAVGGDGRAAHADVDEDALRRALVNLVRNALQAAPAGSTIELRTGRAEDRIRLVVSDRGPGLSADLMPRAFDPFVTGRADGTGLGLALVRRVAEDHGGSARLVTREGGGTDAVIEIPFLPPVEVAS